MSTTMQTLEQIGKSAGISRSTASRAIDPASGDRPFQLLYLHPGPERVPLQGRSAFGPRAMHDIALFGPDDVSFLTAVERQRAERRRATARRPIDRLGFVVQ